MSSSTDPQVSKRGFDLNRPISDLEDYARVLARSIRRNGPETCWALTLADVLDELQERRGGHDWREGHNSESRNVSDCRGEGGGDEQG